MIDLLNNITPDIVGFAGVPDLPLAIARRGHLLAERLTLDACARARIKTGAHTPKFVSTPLTVQREASLPPTAIAIR
jgi:hypothetical protein